MREKRAQHGLWLSLLSVANIKVWYWLGECFALYGLTYRVFSCVNSISPPCCREELCSFQREIEVLSEQYSQKCLENAHLAQALEAERQALRQCQRENQELNAHNQVHTHTPRH